MTIRKAGAGRPRTPEGSSLSPAAALLVAGLLVEIAVGIAAVVHPPGGGTGVLALAGLMVIGSVVVVSRSALPQQAKAVVIVILCALLLMVSASQDPFGMRAVGRELAVERQDDPLAAIAQADGARPAARAVSVRSTSPDPDAQAAATELAKLANATGPTADAEIDGTLTLAGTPDAPTYELNWSLVRAGDRLWCGRATVSAPTRAMAMTQMQSRLSDALAMSRQGPLRCA